MRKKREESENHTTEKTIERKSERGERESEGEERVERRARAFLLQGEANSILLFFTRQWDPSRPPLVTWD